MDDEFPDTYLTRVARAADAAMKEVLEEDRALARLLPERRSTPQLRRRGQA